VTPVLAAASATLSPELRHIVEYHWGWVDAAGQPLRGAAGKMLRPTLAMLSAEAVGAPATRAGAAAAAVEIIHDFTLLHDDVMDGDRERRHRPTAWTVFGVGPAICGGDALVLLAQRLLLADEGDARADAALALNEAAAEVIAGQVLDLSFEGRLDVARRTSRCRPKTGALLACGLDQRDHAAAPTAPCASCAASARAGPRVPGGGRLARHLGRASGRQASRSDLPAQGVAADRVRARGDGLRRAGCAARRARRSTKRRWAASAARRAAPRAHAAGAAPGDAARAARARADRGVRAG
jgi:hypothetical protein